MERSVKLNSISIVLVVLALMLHMCAHQANACQVEGDIGKIYVGTIKKGEKAPCDGFFFSDEAEKDAAQDRDDVRYYEKLVPKLETRLKLEQDRSIILEKRLNLYLELSKNLANDRIRSDNMKFWERTGMFVLGVVVMYGAVDLAR